MNKLAGRITLLLALPTVLGQGAATGAESQVISYPFSRDLPASSRFNVTADGQPVFTHAAEVADFAMFAIRGPVQVTVACEQTVTGAVVRPLSRKIVPQWEAKTVRFTVDGPGPLSVEVNGQIRPALLLFIDPPEELPPPPDAAKIVRFAGGQLHEAGEIRLADDRMLYLEPGAVVRGTVRAVGANRIRILGRGIFDARPRTTKTRFLDFRGCSRRNPQRKPTGSGQWVPWERLTADEQAVARQNRGAIRNVRLSDIQLLEKVPLRSFLVNSGGELSGVTFQNVRQADRVLDRSADLGLSVEDATEVRFAQ